jgi:hypothetical protein
MIKTMKAAVVHEFGEPLSKRAARAIAIMVKR